MIEDFPELLGPLSTMSDADILRFWTICPQLSTVNCQPPTQGRTC